MLFARCSSLLSRASVLRGVAHPALTTITSQHAAPIFTISRASRGVPLCSVPALLLAPFPFQLHVKEGQIKP